MRINAQDCEQWQRQNGELGEQEEARSLGRCHQQRVTPMLAAQGRARRGCSHCLAALGEARQSCRPWRCHEVCSTAQPACLRAAPRRSASLWPESRCSWFPEPPGNLCAGGCWTRLPQQELLAATCFQAWGRGGNASVRSDQPWPPESVCSQFAKVFFSL